MDVNKVALSRVVALHNGKGGVGKTSLVSNLAVTLGAAGIQTLVLDMDPQGNLAWDLGYVSRGDGGAGLRDSLMSGSSLPEPLAVRQHVSVIPGGPELADVDAEGKRNLRTDEHELLAAQLVEAAADFDFILLDTPPNSHSSLTAAALGAAHHLLIPTRIDGASLDGLSNAQIALLKAQEHNPYVTLTRVVITQLNQRATAMHRDVVDTLTEMLDGHRELIADTFVRESAKAAAIQRKYGIAMSEQLTAALGVDVWELIRTGQAVPEITEDGGLVDAPRAVEGTTVRIEKAAGALGLNQDYLDLTKMLVDHINAHEANLVAALEGEA